MDLEQQIAKISDELLDDISFKAVHEYRKSPDYRRTIGDMRSRVQNRIISLYSTGNSRMVTRTDRDWQRINTLESKAMYQKGFRDCVKILKSLGLGIN